MKRSYEFSGTKTGGGMKSLLLAAFAVIATPSAHAQTGNVGGQVNVEGHVTGICAVLVGGSPSNSFSGTIDLGELEGSDGKLAPALAASTITGASQSFTVICNSATPGVSLAATTMTGNASTVLAGYTKTIDYTARLDLGQDNFIKPKIATVNIFKIYTFSLSLPLVSFLFKHSRVNVKLQMIGFRPKIL